MSVPTPERPWTPGPWQWYGESKNGEPYLATTHSGRVFVLDESHAPRERKPRQLPERRTADIEQRYPHLAPRPGAVAS